MRYLLQILCFSSILGLSACASHDPFEPVSSNALHFCDGNRQAVITLRDNADIAAISFEGQTISLPRIETNIDAQAFSNSIYTLYYDDDNRVAVLERSGLPVLTGCKPSS